MTLTVFMVVRNLKKSMDDYILAIKNSWKAKGVEEILMPGEIEANTEAERIKNGTVLSQATVKDLMDLSSRLEISFPEFK